MIGEFSNYSSGLGKAGNIGGGAANSVTFSNVSVPADGTYQLEIDYQTSGSRSYFMSVNGGAETELDLNGSTLRRSCSYGCKGSAARWHEHNQLRQCK